MLRLPLISMRLGGWAALAALAVAGCSNRTTDSRPADGGSQLSRLTGASTLPATSLRLPTTLPAPAAPPSGSPAEPPLDALLLFAQARAAEGDGKQFVAVDLLQKALELDPASVELYLALGNAWRQGRNFEPHAVNAFEQASRLEPDRLETQLELGRQYLLKPDLPKALQRLSLAALTTEYKQRDARSGEVDFLLAHALRESGYDRAALDRYSLLVARLDRNERVTASLAFLAPRLFLQIGDLNLRLGRLDEASAAYSRATGELEHAGDADLLLEARGRVARVSLVRGDVSRGLDQLQQAFREAKGSAAAVQLVKEIYGAIDQPLLGALEQMRRRWPTDRAVLFAWCDEAAERGQAETAESNLAQTWAVGPDASLLSVWVRYRCRHVSPVAAVALLADKLAARPDLVDQIDDAWQALAIEAKPGRLLLPKIQKLVVAPAAEGSKQYILYRLAADFERTRSETGGPGSPGDALSDERAAVATRALAAAVTARPPFAPAFNAQLSRIFLNDSLALAERESQAARLAESAEKGGSPALAQSLRATILRFRQQPRLQSRQAVDDSPEQP